MTSKTTNNVTTQDILNATPRNGDLRLIIDDVMYYVVGADGGRNIVFVDPNKDVCTDQTFEVCLDNFSSIEDVEEWWGYNTCRLIRKNQKDAVLKNCTPHVLNVIVGEEVIDYAPTGIIPRRSQNEEVDGLELPF